MNRLLKTFGYFAHRLGERLPASTSTWISAMIRFSFGLVRLLAEHVQAADQRDAGVDHGRELAAEDRQVLQLDLAKAAARLLRGRFALRLLDAR